MATYLENLIARRDDVAQQLADLRDDNLDKPDASGALPIGVERIAYKDSLYRELDRLNAEISRADAYEITSEMSA